MLINNLHLSELTSPVQTIRARVEIYKGSALEKVCDCGKDLSDFTIERLGEGKFFGYGICQKLKVTFLDEEAGLSLTKDNTLEATFGVGSDFIYPFPNFYVEDVSRDEETGDLVATAYDILYRTANHTVSELQLPDSYNLLYFASACAELLGVSIKFESIADDSAFLTEYPSGANFDGTETIRDALNAVAEATQTIYYINNDWELTFKRLDKDGDSLYTINRTNYMDFFSHGARVLSKISHVTELGDNVEPASEIEGVTQYVRNNPFWELREDVGALVDGAQAIVSGTSIEQFECTWFGNYLLEIGDKISIIGKENKTFTTYILDDSITFDGAIEQYTQWQYDENDAESASNPTSLGEALNKTFARVDKVNREIQIVASNVSNNETTISAIQSNVNSISLSVERAEKNTADKIDNINEDITELKKSAALAVDADSVDIAIKTEMAKGVDKVITTEKHFTFDDAGLNISTDGNEMKTQITEDGMTVYKDDAAVLMANNEGVNALNLHATTYLIIGNTSRLEDWNGRTACFWIGG